MSAEAGASSACATEEEPIRAEIFGVERLEQHAESLAAAAGIEQRPAKSAWRLLSRVRANESVLLAAYHDVVKAVGAGIEITLAEEWFLDNFHVVDEQLREIEDHLPESYYRRLPKLSAGHLAGTPRVYGVAWAYVAHTDSRFEQATLKRFVQAYQRVQPLGIAELWAVPIHLRMALVENLRRLSRLIVGSRRARDDANERADRLMGLSGRPPESTEDVLYELEHVCLPRAFAVQLVQRLRDQDTSILPALAWLDRKLAMQGTSSSEAVAEEHQAQGAANATVRHIIGSMRWMSSIDWLEFFEGVSLVDQILRTAPVFLEMDFATRDEYRKQIEILSRGSGWSELEVAREAVLMAGNATETHPPPLSSVDRALPRSRPPLPGIPDDAERDPGYWLVSKGRLDFERRLGFHFLWRLRLLRFARAHAIQGYLGGVAGLSALQLAGIAFVARLAGAETPSLLLLSLLGILPASEIAVSLLHRLVAAVLMPGKLPKLELAQGVPSTLRTLIAVPSLLTSLSELEEQLERLEVHYLANPEGHLHFALLTDWADAALERMPGDDELLSALSDGIARLNARYAGPPGAGSRFLLLHRRRRWNEREQRWMGWERKRGKLHELNWLLRGATHSSFMLPDTTAPRVPEGVRYVITLDADTRLPKGTAYRLIGAMAHPLNRPRFDPAQGRVVEGYAIMQPRITPSLPTGSSSTTYQRIVSGPAGVDPYAAAVSDVYQDLFAEGSYTGKGIYDVDAFETALAAKVPENALLSHDLFEGVFARAGLLTDVDLFEEFPSNYEVAARRQHRWVRGDWQLLPWILGWARDVTGENPGPHIPFLGRWKMIDNLRRSLVAPASFLMVAAAWILPGGSPLLWTGLFVGAVAVPAVIPVLDSVVPKRRRISKRSHLRALGEDAGMALSRAFTALTVLAHQAWLMSDAALRTLLRLYVTKRHLLEWVPAAQAGYGADLRLSAFYRHQCSGVAMAAMVGALVSVFSPGAWPVAMPFILLWILSPAVAWRISLPPRLVEAEVLSRAELNSLRRLARRTWRFFETFVTKEENDLPPDNFQEDPEAIVAHRTSPTNLGLYLLSTTVARDFGWIGLLDMASRLEATLDTTARMRRFRGHLFNWYDTRDLRPLDPVYVSTVDSGNLAGHLIVVAQACREMVQRPLFGPETLDGIRDALALLLDAINSGERAWRTQTVMESHLGEAVHTMEASLSPLPISLSEWVCRLEQLERQAENLLDIARTLVNKVDPKAKCEVLVWSNAVRDCVASHSRDVEMARLLEGMDAAQRAETPLGHQLAALALRAEAMVQAMDFHFLFDCSRKLFSIGYRVAEGALDPSCYDLLASESRLGSFVAIAKGDVSPQHWFLLGRALTPVGRGAALVSWSGSMFEYLMPILVMRQPAESLLDLTCRLVVQRQIQYGSERDIPWGVSESAHNVRDVELTYQYSDFGVPGLGLRRGLFQDIVVAPYATALAAMLAPKAALQNFARLDHVGARGVYGYYEALDYTPSHLPERAAVAVVKSYMAHHQGMTVVSLGNVVHGNPTRKRFHAHPMVQAAELLLQERTPRSVAVTRPRGEEVRVAPLVRDLVLPALRTFDSPHDTTPRSHLLSNGRYTVMITAAGSGFSRWNGLAVTRWREDTTRDDWGTFVFLRDADTGDVWSAGFQPVGVEADHYEAVYSEDRAKISQRDASLSIILEIVVSPDDDAELRHLTVTNIGTVDREIDFT